MYSSKYTYFAVFVLLWHQTRITESSVNLARGKTTSQSTTYNTTLYPSSKAVNGITDCSHFAHTGLGEYEWWQVDLGDVYEIKKIQIYYRPYYAHRLDGYAINIIKSRNPLETWQCYKDTDIGYPTSLTPSHNCPSLGRYVNFSRESTASKGDKAVINLCELEVYGCPQGFYGHMNCNSKCNASCPNSRCDPDNGNCTCRIGLTGVKCNVIHCNTGSYLQGNMCVPCPTGCVDNNCNVGTGECAKGCKPSFYGTFCNFTCTQNCYNSLCARDSGQCISCKFGFYGDNCDKICPRNCKGNVCKQEGGHCASCNYPYTGITCTECNAVSYSLGANCIPCSTGCRLNTCNAGTGECLNGCYPPFYGTICNLTCSTNCYNTSCARNSGKCFGCKEGSHGDKCKATCPSNCKNEVCRQDDGYCTSCKYPYTGITCTVCVVGLYGKDCDIACPVNCKHKMCDGTDGTCMFGCKYANMTGNHCDGIRTTTEGLAFQINSYIGTIIAGVVSLINIVLILVILTLYCKRRRRKETVYENQKPLDWTQEGMNQQSIITLLTLVQIIQYRHLYQRYPYLDARVIKDEVKQHQNGVDRYEPGHHLILEFCQALNIN